VIEMGWLDGIGIVGVTIIILLAIALGILIAFCFWWFAGYLCATFGWYAMDKNAQLVTWVVLITIGSGTVRK
jgi:hypothetical protein